VASKTGPDSQYNDARTRTFSSVERIHPSPRQRPRLPAHCQPRCPPRHPQPRNKSRTPSPSSSVSLGFRSWSNAAGQPASRHTQHTILARKAILWASQPSTRTTATRRVVCRHCCSPFAARCSLIRNPRTHNPASRVAGAIRARCCTKDIAGGGEGRGSSSAGHHITRTARVQEEEPGASRTERTDRRTNGRAGRRDDGSDRGQPGPHFRKRRSNKGPGSNISGDSLFGRAPSAPDPAAKKPLDPSTVLQEPGTHHLLRSTFSSTSSPRRRDHTTGSSSLCLPSVPPTTFPVVCLLFSYASPSSSLTFSPAIPHTPTRRPSSISTTLGRRPPHPRQLPAPPPSPRSSLLRKPATLVSVTQLTPRSSFSPTTPPLDPRILRRRCPPKAGNIHVGHSPEAWGPPPSTRRGSCPILTAAECRARATNPTKRPDSPDQGERAERTSRARAACASVRCLCSVCARVRVCARACGCFFVRAVPGSCLEAAAGASHQGGPSRKPAEQEEEEKRRLGVLVLL
jgi:hypothetical protein